MKKYFYLDESPIYKNKYVIRLNFENFLFPTGTTGSYGVFIARVMNLDYVDFLRYSRDRLGAELIGKNRKYITPYYDKNENTEAFIKLLNMRMEYIMNEHKYPFEYKEDEDGGISRIPFNKNESNS